MGGVRVKGKGRIGCVTDRTFIYSDIFPAVLGSYMIKNLN